MTLHYSTWSPDSPDPSVPCCLVTKSCLTLLTPCTVAHQAPLSMGFSRQGNTALGCHFLLRGSSQPRYRTHVSCTAGGVFTTEPPGKLYFLGPALYFYFLEGEAPGNFDSRHLHSLSVYLRWSPEDLILKDCLECSYPAWTLMDQDPFLPGSWNLVQETGLPNRPFPNLLSPTGLPVLKQMSSREDFLHADFQSNLS